jgi:uncharacterized coiled-coil protein SlyX
MKRRSQTSTERDMAGIAARKSRDESAPDFVAEECTGKYEGAELERIRSRRPTPERLRILERKQDEDRKAHQELVAMVNETRVDVAGMRGELKVLPELVDLIKSRTTESNKTERVRLTSRARVVIAIVGLGGTALGVLATVLAGCA